MSWLIRNGAEVDGRLKAKIESCARVEVSYRNYRCADRIRSGFDPSQPTRHVLKRSAKRDQRNQRHRHYDRHNHRGHEARSDPQTYPAYGYLLLARLRARNRSLHQARCFSTVLFNATACDVHRSLPYALRLGQRGDRDVHHFDLVLATAHADGRIADFPQQTGRLIHANGTARCIEVAVE